MGELQAGLWHWQAPHPEWTPDQWWPEMVSSYALDDGAQFLLFDPVAVPDEILAAAADREPVVVLTTPWHKRDAQRLVERFGAPVFTPRPDTADDLLQRYGIAPEQIPEGWLSPDVASLVAEGDAEVYRAGDRLPCGLEALPGRLHNDLVVWIERVGAVRHRRRARRLRSRLGGGGSRATTRRHRRGRRRSAAAAAPLAGGGSAARAWSTS